MFHRQHIDVYVLDVRLPVQLLQSLVQVFKGDTTILTLVGGLDYLDAHLLENVTYRDWDHSGGDRAAEIPLTRKNVHILVESILPHVGVRRNVYEVTIEDVDSDRRKILFKAYDNFDRWPGIEGTYNKGAVVTSRIDVQVLDDLVAKQVIRKYLVHDTPDTDWD